MEAAFIIVMTVLVVLAVMTLFDFIDTYLDMHH
jgi:hypothetical protein